MFIEKLKCVDFDNFAKNNSCTLEQIKEIDNNRYYVKLNSGYQGHKPEFYLSDFECIASTYYANSEHEVEKNWRNYLTNKFGEEYKNALNNYLNTELKELDM